MTMGTLMVMLSAAMWGLSGVCGQFLFENYHPYPVWLIAVRQVAAGILFLLVMRIKGEPLLALWRSGRKNITEMLWFTLGLLGAQFMYYYTISVSNAPTSTILQYQAPIFIILWPLHRFLFGDRVASRRLRRDGAHYDYGIFVKREEKYVKVVNARKG